MIMMGFEDSMTDLQTPSEAVMNPTRQVSHPLDRLVERTSNLHVMATT